VVCFSFVLGYSRWQFLRFFRRADAHAVCHAHILAFEEAGGVPHQILYDRMKQIVLESYRHRTVLHPLFDAMRLHYAGFEATPLPAGYKEGKGKVENPFGYAEGNFLKRHRGRFRDLDDLNEKAAEWLRDIARPRKHGTTQERPIDRLDVERPVLLPLPAHRFEAAKVVDRLVGDDFCVAWDSNRYSVPPRLVGHTLKVRVLEGWLEAKQDREVVSREQFLRLGPSARDFVDGLITEHRGAAGYHMSRILALAENAGVPRVAEAIRHAVRYGAFDFNAVARIVKGKTDKPLAVPPASGPLPEHIAEYLRGAGEHQRPLENYEQFLLELTEELEDGE
jgi:hypothetical protein